MRVVEIIKNNAKLYMILSIIILLGTIGISFALVISNFNAIAINTNMLEINADISYDTNSNGEEVVSTGNMLPISDSLVTGPDVTDSRVLKTTFNVTGDSNNPENTIYDIALHNINVGCDLRTKDLKWRLYKGNELISNPNASLSPTFDTMNNNRLVLTDTQQDLTTSTDKYTFLLWISENCPGNITECTSSQDQSKYLGKEFSASIKVELSTKSKKRIDRITGSEGSCDYTPVEIPACNTLTYNGNSQTLINGDSTDYILSNTTGINAGTYKITAKLNDECKWSNGETNDKVLTCNIDKKDVTVTTLNQTITYGNKISSSVNNISSSDLLTSDSIEEVYLSSDTVDVGAGKISTNNVTIVNSNNTDVTSNYNIIKKNTGVVTINCANIAVEPNVGNVMFTGEELTGVTGGSYITITGSKVGTEAGSYKVVAKPNKNYCWSDGTTTEKEYTWNIEHGEFEVVLDNEEANVVGTEVLYGKKQTGIYLDNNYKNKMSSTSNPIVVPEKTGYTFEGYYTEDKGNGTLVINKDGYLVSDILNTTTVLYAKWAASTNTSYQIQHYQMQLDGTYPLTETENKTGTTNNTLTLSNLAKNYTGFTYIYGQVNGTDVTTTTIAADGSRIIKLYYMRNQYTVTLTKGTGISSISGAGNYYYGASVTIDATASSGYTWSNWSGTHSTTTKKYTFTMPASNVTDTANTTINTYTISYNANGGSGSMSDTTAVYDSYVNLSNSSFTKTGYNFAGWSTVGGTKGILNDSKEYSGAHTSNSGYTDFLYYQISAPFAAGEKYRLEVDLKGSGQLANYFYGDSNYLQVSNLVTSTGTVSDATDGANYISLTSDYMHYTVTFTLGSTGDRNVHKTVLFRALPGCTATVKNIKFYKLSSSEDTYIEGSSVKNLTTSGTKTLYAIWAPNNYTISYNANGGSGSTASTVAIYDSYAKLSNNGFSRTGHSFVGWSTSSSTKSIINDSKEYTGTLSSDATSGYNDFLSYQVSAPFAAGEKYRMEIDIKGSGQLVNYFYGGSNYLKVAQIVTSTGSVSTSSDGANYANLTSDYQHYTATFTLGSTGDVNVYKTLLFRVFPGNNATIKNIKFYKLSSSEDTYVEGASVKNLVSSGTKTLYAIWNPDKYTVSYNANGGSGAPAAQTKTHDINLTLSSTTPTRTGYTFLGWSTNSSATTASYSAGGNYTENGNVTLYAVWSVNSYSFNLNILNPDGSEPYSTGEAGTVEMSVNGGSYSRIYNESASSYTYGTVLRFRNFTPGTGRYLSSVTGATESSGVWTVTVTSSTVVQFATAWNTYTVTQYHYYYYQNSSWTHFNTTTNSVNHGSSFTPYNVTAPTGYYAGNNYGHYNSAGSSLGGGTVGSNSFVVTENMSVHVHYYPNTYTVSYNANGGSGAPGSQTKYYATPLTLSSTKPTRAGYDFLGWSTSSSATSATYSAGGSYTANASATLYAVWKQSSVKLIDHIKALYTSQTRTAGTNSTITTYYMSFQDSGKTWGLMNDGYNGTTKVTNTTYLSNGTQGNIRYFGPNPNNYIYFNCTTYPSTGCELWRIVGIVDGKVKIVRQDSLGTLSWHQPNNEGSDTLFYNNWENASLKVFLNGKYYNRGSTTTFTYYSGDSGGTSISLNLANVGIKNANTRNMISPSTWYLGSTSGSSGVYADDVYLRERTNSSSTVVSGNTFSITNTNVGLMYISDYAYSANLNKCTSDLYYYDDSNCSNTSYFHKSGVSHWLLGHVADDTYQAWKILSGGDLGVYYTYNTTPHARPTVYLDTSLSIELGNTGTSSSPYRFKIS